MNGTITVDYSTANKSAPLNKKAYIPVSGTLTFFPGEQVKTITIPVIDDPNSDNLRAFHVRLSNPQQAKVIPGVLAPYVGLYSDSFVWFHTK